VGFKSTVSAGKWLQTYALDGAATGTGSFSYQGSLLRNKRFRKTLIRQVITYGAEYWTVKKDIAKLLADF
jgi:hypothetical protein